MVGNERGDPQEEAAVARPWGRQQPEWWLLCRVQCVWGQWQELEPERQAGPHRLKISLRIADFILRVMGFTGMVVFEEFPKLLTLFFFFPEEEGKKKLKEMRDGVEG